MIRIDKATKKDITLLDKIIKEEFPYTTFSKEKISEKIDDEKFFILKAHTKNIFAGFLELEFMEKEARLNGLFVEDVMRGQGIALELVKRAIHECKRKRIHRIFLLVKEENEAAKHLYKKTGFSFEKEHDKKVDSSIIEVWSLHIN